MELLFEILKFLWWIITWTPIPPDGVSYALAPALIALAGGAALGGANWLIGSGKRKRLRGREKRYEKRMDTASNVLSGDISALQNRAAGIDSNMSAEELYGESIQALTDRAQAGQAGAGAQISKALAAGGGDLSGSMAGTLQRLSQSTNRSIQDIMGEYNQRADRRNLQQASRQDSLFSTALGARQNQFGALTGQYNQAANRSTQKATADKQFFMDALGMGANVGAAYAGNQPSGG